MSVGNKTSPTLSTTNLGVVHPPVDSVLRPLGPRGAPPVRVELDQSEDVVSQSASSQS